MTCQLTCIDELGKRPRGVNNALQEFVRKYRWYRKKLRQLRDNNTRHPAENPIPEFQPGDLVRVKQVSEIKQTLDNLQKTSGCTFQKGMYAHCGGEFRIYRKVDRFFDEAKQKMCRCHNIYLLEGSFCNGKTAYIRRCHRHCHFFWHSEWLESLPETGS